MKTHLKLGAGKFNFGIKFLDTVDTTPAAYYEYAQLRIAGQPSQFVKSRVPDPVYSESTSRVRPREIESAWSKHRTMKTKIPVKWKNFWDSREMFPLLVDPAIDEDRFTFNDDEVTFFAELNTSQEEVARRLTRQRSFWNLSRPAKKGSTKKKRIIDS